MATNNPYSPTNGAGPRKQPPKKQMSTGAALGLLVSLVVGVPLLLWGLKYVMAALVVGTFDNFGFPGLIVFVVVCAIGYFMLSRSGKRLK